MPPELNSQAAVPAQSVAESAPQAKLASKALPPIEAVCKASQHAPAKAVVVAGAPAETEEMLNSKGKGSMNGSELQNPIVTNGVSEFRWTQWSNQHGSDHAPMFNRPYVVLGSGHPGDPYLREPIQGRRIQQSM